MNNKLNRKLGKLVCSMAMAIMIFSTNSTMASDKFTAGWGEYYTPKAKAEAHAGFVWSSDLLKVCPKKSNPKILLQKLNDCEPNKAGTRWRCRNYVEYVCNAN